MGFSLFLGAFIFFCGKRFIVRLIFIIGLIAAGKIYNTTGREIDFYLTAMIAFGYVLCDIAASLKSISDNIKKKDDPLDLFEK